METTQLKNTILTNETVIRNNWKPRNAVWEITLACNLRCGHCGSRAGKPLADELSTQECIDLVNQLHTMDCDLITLSGGEPTLREDWDTIAKAISDKGIFVNMVTNGVYRDNDPRTIAKRALAAGMCNVGVSVDGPELIHNDIRGNGTFKKTMASIAAFQKEGLKTTIMCTINKLNFHRIDEMRTLAIEVGASGLRFQLAKPMGTMEEKRDLVIEPHKMKELLPKLAELKQMGGVKIRVGDSLGYYGAPDKILRGWGWRNRKESWHGCQAGKQAIGIQANGDIKGCLSLQMNRGDNDPFVEGNIREKSLHDIWNTAGAFGYTREFKIEELTGACASCNKAAQCKGGATCVAASVTGTSTEDPYCYYRFTSEAERQHWRTTGKTVAAAAAATLALSMGATSCASSSETDYGVPPYEDSSGDTGADTATDTATDTSADTGRNDTATDTASDTGNDTNFAPEYAVEPDYGVFVDTDSDTASDTGIDTNFAPEYAVEPDYGVVVDTDTAIETDYGLFFEE